VLPRALGAEEIHFLRAVANLLALAIARLGAAQTLEQRMAGATREIEQQRLVAESLHGILTISNSNRTLAEILGYIIAQACRLLGCAAGAIYRLHGQDALLHIQAACGLDADDATLDLPVDWSATGQAAQTRRPVRIADAAVDLPDLSERVSASHPRSLLLRLSTRYPALLAVPLLVKTDVYGAITLYYSAPRTFSEEEVRLAEALSGHAALAIENARLVAAAQDKAVLEERQRLARDLHDSVTQALYGVTLHAEAATRLLAEGDIATVGAYLREVQDTAQEALEEMRLLIFELRPPVLAQVGLAAALQARLVAVEGRANLETRLIVEGVGDLPERVEQGLYRIAREALNNALKHAHARRITVQLRQAPSQVILQMADDGVGFDPAAPRDSGGVGLQGIAERVAQLEGRFTVQSTPGAGTVLRVEVAL